MTVKEANPSEAFEDLKSDPSTLLVDVRSMAEWSFVGFPNLAETGKEPVFVEWLVFPGMSQNDSFVHSLSERLDALGKDDIQKIYFLCRSGGRSHQAAVMMTDVFNAQGASIECINVSEGFEGDLDGTRHRGGVNGWKARGLPWMQS